MAADEIKAVYDQAITGNQAGADQLGSLLQSILAANPTPVDNGRLLNDLAILPGAEVARAQAAAQTMTGLLNQSLRAQGAIAGTSADMLAQSAGSTVGTQAAGERQLLDMRQASQRNDIASRQRQALIGEQRSSSGGAGGLSPGQLLNERQQFGNIKRSLIQDYMGGRGTDRKFYITDTDAAGNEIRKPVKGKQYVQLLAQDYAPIFDAWFPGQGKEVALQFIREAGAEFDALNPKAVVAKAAVPKRTGSNRLGEALGAGALGAGVIGAGKNLGGRMAWNTAGSVPGVARSALGSLRGGVAAAAANEVLKPTGRAAARGKSMTTEEAARAGFEIRDRQGNIVNQDELSEAETERRQKMAAMSVLERLLQSFGAG